MAPENNSLVYGNNNNNNYDSTSWLPGSFQRLDMLLPPYVYNNIAPSSAAITAAAHINQLPLPHSTTSTSTFPGHYEDATRSSNGLFFHNFYPHAWQVSPPPPVVEGNGNVDNDETPRLEDFLGGLRSPPLYTCSSVAAETQDSSLSIAYDYHVRLYDQHNNNALVSITPFPALPANSGSEVEDSASMTGIEIALACSHPPAAPLAEDSSRDASVKKKAIVPKVASSPAHRTSAYRGVTRHRWTGRFEAHLWDNTCVREGQKRKGRQVYLGGYDKEEKAARAYDLAALKYWGPTATINFPVSAYSKEMDEMKEMSRQEFVASLRRRSSGFSRGASIYRGVTRHHQHGRWQARIGRVAGNKDLYLGTFASEEEAAEAYDIAAIKFRGANAVTNFKLSRYDLEAIALSDLPIGSLAKRLRSVTEAESHSLLTGSSPAVPNFAAASLLNNFLCSFTS